MNLGDSWQREQLRNEVFEKMFDMISYYATRLFKLSKDKQIKMLNKLGVTDIPALEIERVMLILKLDKWMVRNL